MLAARCALRMVARHARGWPATARMADVGSLLLASSQPQYYREYHATSRISDSDGGNGKNGGDDKKSDSNTTTTTDATADNNEASSSNAPNYLVMNDTDMTEAEIEKMFEEEEERMRLEEEAKYTKDWKPGMRKRVMQQSNVLEDFMYELEPEKYKPKWTLRDKRCGALAIKIGMMPIFDSWGVRHPCTILYLDNNIVLGHKTMEKHGYFAVQVAAGERKRKNVGKCVLGQYKNMLPEDENPPYLVREFRVTDESLLIPINSQIHAAHFVAGQNVDISGISKGKGFQGVMKRHGFSGLPASHGQSKAHRIHGSVGQVGVGKVFKGKKMAGHMGAERVTVQNHRIVKVDRGRNLLFIKGAVPGNKGAFVEIRDAVKRPLWGTDMVHDGIDRPPLPTFEYEGVDGCGESGHELFMPLPHKDPLDPKENVA